MGLSTHGLVGRVASPQDGRQKKVALISYVVTCKCSAHNSIARCGVWERKELKLQPLGNTAFRPPSISHQSEALSLDGTMARVSFYCPWLDGTVARVSQMSVHLTSFSHYTTDKDMYANYILIPFHFKSGSRTPANCPTRKEPQKHDIKHG